MEAMASISTHARAGWRELPAETASSPTPGGDANNVYLAGALDLMALQRDLGDLVEAALKEHRPLCGAIHPTCRETGREKPRLQ
jgi:hypothetical protein